eukprot:c14202_g2_i1 orf=2-295(-)
MSSRKLKMSCDRSLNLLVRKLNQSWEATNKSMRDQKEEMNRQYQKLKKKMAKLRRHEHQELKAMSKISEEVRQNLTKKLEMAKRIIKLAELNSKNRNS